MTKHFPWKDQSAVKITGTPFWVWTTWLVMWSVSIEGLFDLFKWLLR